MEKIVHFCDFVEHRLEGIHRISKFNNFSNNRIAVSRTDGSLEIWLYLKRFYYWEICSKIPGRKDYMIEFLVWTRGGALITGDTRGCVIKWNFGNLIKNEERLLEYGAITSMDYSPKTNELLISSGDSVLRILADDFQNEKIVLKNLSDVVSIAFHPSGEKFLVGTQDSKVFIYSLDGKQSTYIDIKAFRTTKCIPWVLLFLSDFTIVIGDSLGQVQFWDAYTSTCIQILKCHKKDTITLCSDLNENFIISGSIDKTVNCITKISDFVSKSSQTGYSYIKIFDSHHNDVYSVSIGPIGNTVISGGYDGIMCHYSVMERSFKKVSIFGISNEFSNYSITQSPKNITYHTNDKIFIYKFEQNSISYEKSVEISNKTNFNIGTCTISPDGQFLHFSTFERLFLYQISYKDKKQKDMVLKKIKELKFGCIYAKFTTDSKRIVTIGYDSLIRIYDIESENIIFTETLPVDNSLDKKWGIDFFKDKCFLFLYSKPFTAFILDIQNQIMAEFCNIYKPIIAAFINMNLKSIVCVSLDGRIMVVKIREDPEITEHKIKLHLHHTHGFVNIFHDKISDILYLQTVDHISCYYSKDKTGTESQNFPYNKIKTQFRNVRNWFVYSECHSDGSLIAITKKPSDIYSSIQPPVFLKKFTIG